jgi:hypothetical protein
MDVGFEDANLPDGGFAMNINEQFNSKPIDML